MMYSTSFKLNSLPEYTHNNGKSLKYDVDNFKSFDKLINSQKSQGSYGEAKEFLFNLMQDLIDEFKNKGFDTTELEISKKNYEKKIDLKAKLRDEIAFEARTLLQNNDKTQSGKVATSIAEKLARYDPVVDIDDSSNFFSLIMDYISDDIKEKASAAIATMQEYDKQNTSQIDLGGGNKLTWMIGINGKVEFKIENDERIIQSQMVKQQAQMTKTLLEIFNQRENLKETNSNDDKNTLQALLKSIGAEGII